MNLEQLTNLELSERFEKLDHQNFVLKDRSGKIMEAYIELVFLPGVQDDANGSRQTIIDFIRDQEESQQPRSKQTVEGGRRSRKSRGRKSRRSKSRRNRK